MLDKFQSLANDKQKLSWGGTAQLSGDLTPIPALTLSHHGALYIPETHFTSLGRIFLDEKQIRCNNLGFHSIKHMEMVYSFVFGVIQLWNGLCESD